MEFPDEEQMEVLDDCMSFPDLFVKVNRYRRCKIKYKDTNWEDCVMELEGDLSELLQHEYDHLDGILATMRAIDNKSFYTRAYVKG
jgi:peptide deformylase